MIRAITLIILLSPGLLSAQFVRLSPQDPVKNGLFGHAVDLDRSGRVALIGSPGANIRTDLEDFSGTAYLFTRDGDQWSQHAKLIPTRIDRNDAFGSAVALSRDGRFAVVGAPLASTVGYASGAAYLFVCDESGCNEQALFVPPTHEPGDLFGISVAVDEIGSIVVIGASGRSNHGGSAWVFFRGRDGWSEGRILEPDRPQAFSSFGRSVATNADGSVIWIGAPLDRSLDHQSGAVYVFSNSDGEVSLQTILHPAVELRDAMFGYALSLAADGSFGVVGAPGVGREGSTFGTVTLFVDSGSGWASTGRLVPPNPGEAAWFGSSVVTNDAGSFLVAGAPGDARNGFRAGRAFVFARWKDQWSLARELEPDSTASDDRFGFAVALDGEARQAVIGARESPANEYDAGLAFAFGSDFLPVSNEVADDQPLPTRVGQPEVLSMTIFPNPNAGYSQVNIKSTQPGIARLEAFDIRGRKVADLFSGKVGLSGIEIGWDTAHLPPGAYLLRLRAGDSQVTSQLVSAR